MSLNIQIVNGHVVVGSNSTSLASDGFTDGTTNPTQYLIIPSVSNEQKPIDEIGSGAFYYYHNLITVQIEPSMKQLNQRCFQHCINLISVSIPFTVERIFKSAFDDCYELQSVTFDVQNKLEILGYRAFDTCKKLSFLVLPGSIKFIGNEAFREIETNFSLYYFGTNTFSSISRTTLFGQTNVNIYVPMNGASSFANVPTIRISSLPLLPTTQCNSKITLSMKTLLIILLTLKKLPKQS